MKKKIPEFKSEDKERGFWSGRDSTKYLNWTKAKRVSLKSISLRLPESMIEELKLLANKKDVPYQSLLKIFLAEKIREELDQLV